MPAFYTAHHTTPGSIAPEFVELQFDPEHLRLTCAARAGAWHYFRLADGTVKPLPPHPAPLVFEPGDTYIALSPSARRVTDSPTVARFLHLHDFFNAEKLAASLLAHLVDNAGGLSFPEAVAVIVVEAR